MPITMLFKPGMLAQSPPYITFWLLLQEYPLTPTPLYSAVPGHYVAAPGSTIVGWPQEDWPSCGLPAPEKKTSPKTPVRTEDTGSVTAEAIAKPPMDIKLSHWLLRWLAAASKHNRILHCTCLCNKTNNRL